MYRKDVSTFLLTCRARPQSTLIDERFQFDDLAGQLAVHFPQPRLDPRPLGKATTLLSNMPAARSTGRDNISPAVCSHNGQQLDRLRPPPNALRANVWRFGVWSATNFPTGIRWPPWATCENAFFLRVDLLLFPVVHGSWVLPANRHPNERSR